MLLIRSRGYHDDFSLNIDITVGLQACVSISYAYHSAREQNSVDQMEPPLRFDEVFCDGKVSI